MEMETYDEFVAGMERAAVRALRDEDLIGPEEPDLATMRGIRLVLVAAMEAMERLLDADLPVAEVAHARA
jgi:hypothetical protein